MSVALAPEDAAFVRDARVARLGTSMPGGGVHVVPICPALGDDGCIYVATEPGQKVTNIEHDRRVGLTFDAYDEDWSKIRRVSVRGVATLHRDGEAWDLGRELLYAKFPQYEPEAEIVRGRTVVIRVELEWVSQGRL
jgi:nitroimidazol reductase NimA-like FMN-containing flavoprotein (pyridoxamine 5'-phosphate oxidase superfamily)